MVTKIENIPNELKELPNWVCWKMDEKTPYNPATGKKAMADNSKTWGTFKQAVKACDTFGFDGVGFEFAPPYFGVDLDHCMDNKEIIEEFTESLQSYTEISRSGQGIHIICKGELPDGRKRKGDVEMYKSGRYFILTGNLLNDKYKDINECSESIKILKNKYLPEDAPAPVINYESITLDDSEIIEKAKGCRTGYLFDMLYNGKWEGVYPSQSEADLTFCNILAFWTQKNAAQMDRIFRSSGLYRKKWDSRRNGTTYGEMTICNAIDHCSDVYDPKKHISDEMVTISMFDDGEVAAAPSKVYDMTDTGNAQRFKDKYGNGLRYSYYRKKWYYWTGKQWLVDDVGKVKSLADGIIDDIKREAIRESDEDAQRDLFKWAYKTASSRTKEAMIKECQHLDGIPVVPEEFDACKDYLNCQNGVINLRNGELLKHEPGMMITKMCISEYGEGKPEKWLKFLDDITDGDKELQEYMQRCVGYSITGYNGEQCAFFMHGNGNNGKSTFIDTLADLFGTYASNTQPETVMVKKREGGGANSDVARLKSARFVTVQETDEGVRLNEGLLKQITGGSRITARHLYGEEFEYTPEFKLWIATNHKPVIRGTDFGIWRRIKLMPFEVKIPKEKIDKNLRYNLRSEFPQILRWAVEGAIKWYEDGLHEPTVVTDAVKEYKNEMDLLAAFIDECIVVDTSLSLELRANELFQIYSRWAKTNNEYEMTSKKFFREIGKKFPDMKKRDGSGIFYKGLAITANGEELMGKQYRLEDFR